MERRSESESLIEMIYEAAVSPARWHDVMNEIGRTFQSHTGAVIAVGSSRSEVTTIFSSADRTSSINDYQHHWAKSRFKPVTGKTLDILQAGTRLAVGAIRSDVMLMSREELEISAFYNEHLLRFDFIHAFVAKVWESSDDHGVLSLSRSRQSGAFTANDIARYAVIQSHLLRALAMAQRLSWTQVGGRDGERSYRDTACPTLLVDRHGACGWPNRSAEALFRESDRLRLVRGRLRTPDAASDLAFAEAIDRAVNGHGDARRGGSAKVSRGDRRPPLIALVSPIGSGSDWFLPSRPYAMVVFFDPSVRSAPSAERLRALYSLTVSEAAVAQGIARGLDLSIVASDLGLTVNTARQYLTRVYTKTDTTRQHDLARLLVRLAEVM